MLKKILLVSLTLALAGCSVKMKKTTPFDEAFLSEMQRDKTKTAVILPLSGESAALGDAFRNAILMAQLERATDERNARRCFGSLSKS